MNYFVKKTGKLLLDILFPPGELSGITSEKISGEIKKTDWQGNKDILVLFDYEDKTVKKLIWELKYKNNGEAGRVLSEMIYSELLEYLSDWIQFENFTDPLLVPVPISKKKLKKRGYNQTEILAEEILKLDEGKNFSLVLNVLKKVKETEDQSSLNKSKRLKNLKDCFQVKDYKKIKGRNIIVIDDVVTTGATLREIKKTLKNSGANKIKSLVIAH